MTDLAPFYTDVQAHYDLSDDFFGLFLDKTRTYSCAYFEHEGMTLEQAQVAKVDLALAKCDLRPGMTLLDVGCGWGGTMMRAIEKYDVNVIGLTLSRNQHDYVQGMFDKLPGHRSAEVRLQGWEEYDGGPVDRIVSIGAFEHFRRERYDAFFNLCHDLLPADGRMLLHTIVGYHRHQLRDMGLKVDRNYLSFCKFLIDEIFPGGQLPEPPWVRTGAEAVGFRVERIHPLQLHYAQTLEIWTQNLIDRHDDAVAIASQEVFDRYVKYLSGCATMFRDGYFDIMQFTLVK
ncbi:cyclopropane mycolic acid synthase family methyltransferase [Antrihabitans sp. NCIMB 15449]|uniref:Cyclopropane mycolic acid synthase family methyltransferase n=1 Tax=Antrihabitans spumae TaxID=3373370 RepID=A0ABW7JGW9_9NOCA